jgi:ABC-type transport system involved in multi-copper enzyme maturation permease subunit
MAETARDMHAPRPARDAVSRSPERFQGRSSLTVPSAVLAIFWNEIRQLTGGIRFRVSAFLLVAVMALAAVTAGARYRDDVLAQASVIENHARETTGLSIDRLAEEQLPALKPPWRLSLVVDGGQTATPDLYGQALSALVTPEIRRIRGGNSRIPSREPLDWMFTLRILLPLAAFLLGYDAVCGERRAGTLKLLLSYPVSRWKVLAGKLLALWSCLVAPLLAGAILSLLLAAWVGGIPLTAGDLARAGMVLLLGLWAAFFFVLAALLVSALSRDPSASLSVLAWLWVAGVIVVPAVSGLLAHRLRPVPTEGDIGLRMKAIARQQSGGTGGEGRWRQPEWAAADGFAWERRSAAAENRRFALQEDVRRKVFRSKAGQARMARSLSALSPMSLTQDLAERLTGSGLGRDESFHEQARSFRAILVKRIESLDARDPQSPHILFFSGYLSKRPIKTGDLPRFDFQEKSLGQGLADARLALSAFALETITLAAVSIFVFSRHYEG